MGVVQKEPALAAGAVGAVLALLIVYGVLDMEKAAAWQGVALVVIPVLQGLWTRSRVFSPNTIIQAGLSPEDVKADAANPEIWPLVEDGR